MVEQMDFRRLGQSREVCVICESDAMAEALVMDIPNEISIFHVGGTPPNPWKSNADVTSGIIPEWNQDFQTNSFDEYILCMENDYNGLRNCGIAFMAIKQYHPEALILDCRIDDGPNGDIERIFRNINQWAVVVGHDNEGLEAIAAVYNSQSPLPSSLHVPLFGQGLTSIQYIENIKILRKQHKLEIYNFSLAWGKRRDLKTLILLELLQEVGNEFDDGFVPMSLIVAKVERAFQIQINETRSRWLDQSPLPQLLDDLSEDEMPLIIERKGRKNSSFNFEDYLQYKLNYPLFQAVFQGGLEGDPFVPLGAFTGCTNYNGLYWKKEEPNDIMRFILLKSLGENPRKTVFNHTEYAPFINGAATHINHIITIWNLLLPDTPKRRVRRRINFILNEHYRTSLEKVSCCGQLFSIINRDLQRHLLEPHFLV